jgi:hypothetical protein
MRGRRRARQYEETFDVPADWATERVTFAFEGVYRDAMVHINGDSAGQWANGYSTFHIPADPYLAYGQPNTIRVEVQAHEDSRWYGGAGIHRPAACAPRCSSYHSVAISTVLRGRRTIRPRATQVVPPSPARTRSAGTTGRRSRRHPRTQGWSGVVRRHRPGQTRYWRSPASSPPTRGDDRRPRSAPARGAARTAAVRCAPSLRIAVRR